MSISRRSFVQGAGLAAAATAVASTATVAVADQAAEERVWEAEADIVICGTGCAGLAAAITACVEELGTTINLEAAPFELRGGNSSATQGVVFCSNDKESAVIYQTVLNDSYEVPADIIDAWAPTSGT